MIACQQQADVMVRRLHTQGWHYSSMSQIPSSPLTQTWTQGAKGTLPASSARYARPASMRRAGVLHSVRRCTTLWMLTGEVWCGCVGRVGEVESAGAGGGAGRVGGGDELVPHPLTPPSSPSSRPILPLPLSSLFCFPSFCWRSIQAAWLAQAWSVSKQQLHSARSTPEPLASHSVVCFHECDSSASSSYVACHTLSASSLPPLLIVP
eukprot:2410214-Rhodomonas_salina.1